MKILRLTLLCLIIVFTSSCHLMKKGGTKVRDRYFAPKREVVVENFDQRRRPTANPGGYGEGVYSGGQTVAPYPQGPVPGASQLPLPPVQGGYGAPTQPQFPPQSGYGVPELPSFPPQGGYGAPTQPQFPPQSGYGVPELPSFPPQGGYGAPAQPQFSPQDALGGGGASLNAPLPPVTPSLPEFYQPQAPQAANVTGYPQDNINLTQPPGYGVSAQVGIASNRVMPSYPSRMPLEGEEALLTPSLNVPDTLPPQVKDGQVIPYGASGPVQIKPSYQGLGGVRTPNVSVYRPDGGAGDDILGVDSDVLATHRYLTDQPMEPAEQIIHDYGDDAPINLTDGKVPTEAYDQDGYPKLGHVALDASTDDFTALTELEATRDELIALQEESETRQQFLQ